jgi:hypothetical protein
MISPRPAARLGFFDASSKAAQERRDEARSRSLSSSDNYASDGVAIIKQHDDSQQV